MKREELRLECLRLAHNAAAPHKTVETATAYFAFLVQNEKDGRNNEVPAAK
jgi:hypothetical protein